MLVRTAPAHADDASNKAAAEALFDDGRELMEKGSYAEACPKFEASQKLDPGVGTMLYLADCYERTGRTASAWAEFREAGAAAHNAGSLDREEIAKKRGDALEPKLSYLTIVAWKGQTVQVTRDDTPVDAAALGVPMPVDPGTHVIVATAPGKRKWATSVEVGAGGARISVAVPILPDDSAESGGTPVTAPSTKTESASHPENPGSTQRAVAIGVGGLGVVGVVLGTVFGVKASSDWSDAKSHCNPYPYCGESGVSKSHDARSAATVSTVAFVVGGAALAGGALLWFTAPKAPSEAGVAFGIGPNGIVSRGRF